MFKKVLRKSVENLLEVSLLIILSRNECPYPPSPVVKEFLNRYIDSINRYEIPSIYEDLISRLAEYNSIGEEYIELLLGSEEFFTILPWFMIRNKYSFMYFNPTFEPAIEDLSVWNINLTSIDLDENFMINTDIVLDKCNENTVVYIVRPNNPTGNLPIDCKSIGEIADHTRLVIIDEAYFEFSKQTCINMVKNYSNIVILRTLSKAFCIAGARLGYVITSPETLRELMRVKRKYSIPVSTILIGLGALNDIKYMESIVYEIVRTRDYVVNELSRVQEVRVYNTLTNFILVGKEEYDSKKLYEKLLENNIVVKPLENRLSKFIRVSIGRREEMEKFIDVIKKI